MPSHAGTCLWLQVTVEYVDWSQLAIGRRLGRGAEGSVYEVRFTEGPLQSVYWPLLWSCRLSTTHGSSALRHPSAQHSVLSAHVTSPAPTNAIVAPPHRLP
jgi:hypothetical protein